MMAVYPSTRQLSANKAPLLKMADASHGTVLQRQCACGSHTRGAECEECKTKREAKEQNPSLQRTATNSDEIDQVPSIVYDVLRSPGQPLGATTRAFMESRFGRDFSRVRVHTDSKSAESARTVNALAYTVGRDLVFGADKY